MSQRRPTLRSSGPMYHSYNNGADKSRGKKVLFDMGRRRALFQELFDFQLLALHFGPCRGWRWRDRDGLRRLSRGSADSGRSVEKK